MFKSGLRDGQSNVFIPLLEKKHSAICRFMDWAVVLLKNELLIR